MEVTRLKRKWDRQDMHTSHLAPLLTFLEHSAHRTIEGPTFVPQHAQLWSPSLIASHSERHKPVHCRCLSWSIQHIARSKAPRSFHNTPSHGRHHGSPLVQSGTNQYIAGAFLYCSCCIPPRGKPFWILRLHTSRVEHCTVVATVPIGSSCSIH